MDDFSNEVQCEELIEDEENLCFTPFSEDDVWEPFVEDKFLGPTQVKFIDPDEGSYIYGIGYNDEIICACCGCVYSIDEIVDAEVSEGRIPIFERKHWYSLREVIEEEG